MARYKDGINGSFSGTVGKVVGASWRGIDYMRSKPAPFERTDAQLIQQAKFTLVSGWLKPLRDLIWIGYKFITDAKTPMNGAMSYHLTEAVLGDAPDYYRIDFPKAIFSRGELIISLIREIHSLIKCLIEIMWDDIQESVFCSKDDKATIIVYNPAKGKFVTFENAADRAEGVARLTVPKNFSGDTVHGYLQYVSADGQRVSTTQYLGEILVG
ncbi:DUF6266 family protein [Pedobacter faecalis]|uniref:DUF6266 family protein n=1 Tax=Pedobacter faecalis TaxID=3041495 RepID=UPI00254C9CB2|nr:DUF6266 family protein [Pedobacter sp. ELA7]